VTYPTADSAESNSAERDRVGSWLQLHSLTPDQPERLEGFTLSILKVPQKGCEDAIPSFLC
jgi:hypothetical protein